jgi:colanic acid biosynthesis glycosyl transferase WcaI
MTSTSRHSATASRSSAAHHPARPAATPATPAPDIPARPPNAPIADASGPAPDTQPDLAGTEILVLSLYYWPERAGSAPPVQQMAEALARLGAEVTVLTARPAYPEMSVYPEYRNGARDRETHQGVTIRRISIASYKPGGSLVTRLTTEGHFAVRAWWSLLRMPRPDRLVTVCPSILAIAAGVIGAQRVPCHLAIIHDLQSGLAKSLEMTRVPVLASLITWLERQTLNRVDRIVTLSQGMVEAIRAIGVKTPIDIIPPTVDDTLIRPLPEHPGPFTALYSGNVGRKQGLDQLLDLAECIQQRRLDIRIIIRGDGNYREALQARAAERRIDSVLFEPLKPEEQLAEGLADGHVHLVPQNPAGAGFALPSKVYAIMAAGRSFICTAEPGSPLDQLREASDAFVVCSPNQPERLVEALERLMRDPRERDRLGRNGRGYVERHAGRGACADAYRSALHGARPVVNRA